MVAIELDGVPYSEDSVVEQLILEEIHKFAKFLTKKNAQYGSSVVKPVRIFAKDIPIDTLIRARIDDKLSRLLEGDSSIEPDEDILKDLAGYYILWQVQRRLHDEAKDNST